MGNGMLEALKRVRESARVNISDHDIKRLIRLFETLRAELSGKCGKDRFKITEDYLVTVGVLGRRTIRPIIEWFVDHGELEVSYTVSCYRVGQIIDWYTDQSDIPEIIGCDLCCSEHYRSECEIEKYYLIKEGNK